MKKSEKYWLHGSAGENLHFQTNDFEAAKKQADSFNSKTTVSILENGESVWTGKPCKVFNQVYSNQTKK